MEAGVFDYLESIHYDLLHHPYRFFISLEKLVLIYSGWFAFISCFAVYVAGGILRASQKAEGPEGRKTGKLASFAMRHGQTPKIIGVFYLSIIPVFGTIYASMPANSIYSSTRMLGDNFHQDGYNYRSAIEDSVGHEIRDAIQASLTARGLTAYISVQGIDVFSNDYIEVDYIVEVLAPDRSKERVGLSAKLYLTRIGLYQLMPTADQTAMIPAFVGDIRCNIERCDEIIDILKKSPEGNSIYNLAIIDAPTSNSSPFVLRMSEENYDTYRDLNEALNGNALGNYGRLSRALYLSTAVLTTLGFGDIVPVSDQARWWVMLQAVLGIVVAGLFLNALAAKSRD